MMLRQVHKMGIKVSNDTTMLGSYAPSPNPTTVDVPRNDWLECPSGMLARGSCSGRVVFLDDDKLLHYQIDFSFDIKKDWA
jgi:Rho GDP-dissociation inhibitor